MKFFLFTIYLSVILLTGGQLCAQSQEESPAHLIRIYEDNDFMNVYFRATDDAYTNGTSINLFYSGKKNSSFMLDRLMPKAGRGSVDVYGWGIAQIIFTPNDLNSPLYQPDDYPYSGALFLTHTLYSYNVKKKFDFQTEWVAGVRGPASLAKQTQDLIHQWGGFDTPEGWKYQEADRLLVNINFTAEKQLFSYKGIVEMIAGGQVSAGSMTNAFALYPELRFGKMAPYFNGYISQYAEKQNAAGRHGFQIYFRVRPTIQYVLTNTLVQGKAPGAEDPEKRMNESTEQYKPFHDLSPFVFSFRYGAVLTCGHTGMSFDMNYNSTQLKGLYDHEFGNVTLYYNY
jgi:lipid A 3-O-deacylase